MTRRADLGVERASSIGEHSRISPALGQLAARVPLK
jgi:hypothetical protein